MFYPDVVAFQFKVSDNSVQQAKALLSEAPDLVRQVESCAVFLSTPYEQLPEWLPDRWLRRRGRDSPAREAQVG
jgi:hypothetical protein